MTNTDLDSNKANGMMVEGGMSPIKVEDESEEVMTPRRRARKGEKRDRSNKKSASNSRKPPPFAV